MNNKARKIKTNNFLEKEKLISKDITPFFKISHLMAFFTILTETLRFQQENLLYQFNKAAPITLNNNFI